MLHTYLFTQAVCTCILHLNVANLSQEADSVLLLMRYALVESQQWVSSHVWLTV